MLEYLSPNEILAYYGVKPYKPVPAGPETTILYRAAETIEAMPATRKLGFTLLIIAIGAFTAASYPIWALEASYQIHTVGNAITQRLGLGQPQPQDASTSVSTPGPLTSGRQPTASAPEFNPLVDPKGNTIVPVNRDFSLIVPKVGINAPIIPGVNPVNPAGYLDALKKGVAHASTSFYPDQNGTVYLFSHSTNYEWFIKDLNAVFYYLKNIQPGDLVVIMYQGNRYTYRIREKKIVSPREISYLIPQPGSRNLILQACWPPGSTYKRLLIFADLIDEKIYGKFKDVELTPKAISFGSLLAVNNR